QKHRELQHLLHQKHLPKLVCFISLSLSISLYLSLSIFLYLSLSLSPLPPSLPLSLSMSTSLPFSAYSFFPHRRHAGETEGNNEREVESQNIEREGGRTDKRGHVSPLESIKKEYIRVVIKRVFSEQGRSVPNRRHCSSWITSYSNNCPYRMPHDEKKEISKGF